MTGVVWMGAALIGVGVLMAGVKLDRWIRSRDDQ